MSSILWLAITGLLVAALIVEAISEDKVIKKYNRLYKDVKELTEAVEEARGTYKEFKKDLKAMLHWDRLCEIFEITKEPSTIEFSGHEAERRYYVLQAQGSAESEATKRMLRMAYNTCRVMQVEDKGNEAIDACYVLDTIDRVSHCYCVDYGFKDKMMMLAWIINNWQDGNKIVLEPWLNEETIVGRCPVSPLKSLSF